MSTLGGRALPVEHKYCILLAHARPTIHHIRLEIKCSLLHLGQHLYWVLSLVITLAFPLNVLILIYPVFIAGTEWTDYQWEGQLSCWPRLPGTNDGSEWGDSWRKPNPSKTQEHKSNKQWCVCVLHIVYVSTGGNKCIQHICGSGGFINLERGVQPLVQRARVATPTSGT